MLKQHKLIRFIQTKMRNDHDLMYNGQENNQFLITFQTKKKWKRSVKVISSLLSICDDA